MFELRHVVSEGVCVANGYSIVVMVKRNDTCHECQRPLGDPGHLSLSDHSHQKPYIIRDLSMVQNAKK